MSHCVFFRLCRFLLKRNDVVMTCINLLDRIGMGCVCGHESKTVNGRRYIVKTRLGEGGFSYVDLVEESRTRQLFALKRITCHSEEDELVAKKEIEYMNLVHHKNLVPCEASEMKPIHGHYTAISEVLIVMPYYRKGSVHDELIVLRKCNSHIPEKKILEIFRGVCEGLKALHTASPIPLAHRDVKPHNVLLEDDDNPVLMDFGSMAPARTQIKSASEAIAMTDNAAERCSMPYRAPELFNVEKYSRIDEKVDIWSLGCLLYSMCFYESPFDAIYQRGDSIALAVLTGVNIPESLGYSEGIRNLMSSMLVVDPAERPTIHIVIQHTQALLNTLDNRV